MAAMSDVRRRSYKDLTLPQLRSFCEVCRLGSYAAAARQLLLTTPAVWVMAPDAFSVIVPVVPSPTSAPRPSVVALVISMLPVKLKNGSS